jgi:Tfp pilus assembly protein PilX
MKPQKRRSGEDGVALITVLLLLLLLTGLTLVMSISVSSDMMMNGYYGDFRGAFYAADSGVAVVRKELGNELVASMSASSSAGTSPFVNGKAATVLANVQSEFGSSSTAFSQTSSTSSWPGSFYIDSASVSDPTCTLGSSTQWTCTFSYSLSVVGKASKTYQQARVAESGAIIVSATSSGTSSAQRSFAAWGTFLNENNICDAELIGGTITGPQFTNGAWTFGADQSYIFTDDVGSVSSVAGYYFSGNSCIQSSQSSYKSGYSTIAPTFDGAFNLGQKAVALPTNDTNQKRAVLDSLGTSSATVSNAELSASLKDSNGTAYPSSGASTGVYLPYTVTVDSKNNQINTFSGGGIYVEGNASVVLETSSTTAQVYVITQTSGSTTTTTTITIDNTANTTTFASSAKTGSNKAVTSTKTIAGVPTEITQGSGASTTSNATILYVDGNITGLSGSSSTAASIQDGTALTITAANNITVTNNILYNTEPVTLTGSSKTAIDSLIPANNNGQTLGIFTANGAVILKPQTNGQNLEIDGSVVATSSADANTASCTVTYICDGTISVANGSTIGTLTIVGGRIQYRAQTINSGTIGTRNILFDRRYASGAFAPPFFPATTVTTTSSGTDYNTASAPTIQRTHWTSRMAY